jgi:hypothetical protein
VDTLQAVVTHQPGDTLAADPDIEAEAQLGVDARCAVGATAAGMDLTDPLAQQGVPAVVVRRGRDAQA